MSLLDELPSDFGDVPFEVPKPEKTYPLSERESWRYDFAAPALRGILAHDGVANHSFIRQCPDDLAALAADVADALLLRLELTGEA